MQTTTYIPHPLPTRCVFGIELKQWLSMSDPSRMVVVTDEHVHPIIRDAILPFRTLALPSGEGHKRWSMVERILNQLSDWQLDRQDTLVAIGGGVVTDLAGLAASLYKRGIPLIAVPTTLMAMVDASLGGKNGVNTEQAKNQLGTVYHPSQILFDFSLLASLPGEEWTSGWAEVIKHACISDAALFSLLEKHPVSYYPQHPVVLQELVIRNVKLKYGIVCQDPDEIGTRQLLNFGHTYGHALEHLTGIPHGHAIAVGMRMACRLSERWIGFDPAQTRRLEALLEWNLLPLSHQVDKEALFDKILKDKKRAQDSIRLVLLKHIGEPVIYPVSLAEYHNALHELT